MLKSMVNFACRESVQVFWPFSRHFSVVIPTAAFIELIQK